MGVPDDPCDERMKPNAGHFSGLLKDKSRDAVSEDVISRSSIGDSSCLTAVAMEQAVSLPPDMMRKKNIEVLRVEGDSMIVDHLLDGDLLIIEKRNTAGNGEMVVVLLRNGWTTVRRFFDEGRRIRLEPADPAGESEFFDVNDVAVQGVVVGVLRKHRA